MFKHTGTINLETERLLLRRFDLNDTESMLNNWISNPRVQLNYGEPIYETKDSVRELLSKWILQYQSDMFYRWAIIEKESYENIGQIAFCRVYTEIETAEIEYCIGESYWGNGFAAEALIAILKYSFEQPKFAKLEAFHRLENPNSGRVLEKAGMKSVDNVMRFEVNNIKPAGEVCYAMTRDKYLRNKGNIPLLKYLGKEVKLKIDRPLGSSHPKQDDIYYTLNYGYIPDTVSGDGEEIDAYVIGEFLPVYEYEGTVIAVIHRKNDDEDKLVVSKQPNKYSKEQIKALVEFQERFFDTEIIIHD